MSAFNIEKKLLKSGEIRYERKVEKKEEGEKKKEKKEDPYAKLIGDMKKFAKQIDKNDRLTSAQMIGRFKNEFSILSAKHETESGKTAERLLGSIEKEFEKRYG